MDKETASTIFFTIFDLVALSVDITLIGTMQLGAWLPFFGLFGVFQAWSVNSGVLRWFKNVRCEVKK